MSNCITICPIGVVEENFLARITKCIEKHHDLVCKISPGMEKPNYAYDERRGQYNSKLILKHLIKCCPQDTLRFIAVTHVDMYVPILKFVFGLAPFTSSKAASISSSTQKGEGFFRTVYFIPVIVSTVVIGLRREDVQVEVWSSRCEPTCAGLGNQEG